MSQLNFQLDFLDGLVKTLRDMAGEHEAMSRNLHGRAGAAQSVGAEGWVVDQVRFAGSLLGEHPGLFDQLSRDLKGRMDIAHTVADEWQGTQSGLRIALTAAMTVAGGLLGATAAALAGNQKGQKTDKKAAKTAVLGASAKSQSTASVIGRVTLIPTSGLARLAPVGDVDGEPILYNPPGNVESADKTGRIPGQCAELVQRVFEKKHGTIALWPIGSAKDMITLNPPETVAWDNGGSSPPVAGDAIVFGETAHNSAGHVAQVVSVTADSVTFKQQNISRNDGNYVPMDTVHLAATEAAAGTTYQVGPSTEGVTGESGITYGKVLGWVRALAQPRVDLGPSPSAGSSATLK